MRFLSLYGGLLSSALFDKSLLASTMLFVVDLVLVLLLLLLVMQVVQVVFAAVSSARVLTTKSYSSVC